MMWMINAIPDAAILIDRDRNIISANLLKQPTFFYHCDTTGRRFTGHPHTKAFENRSRTARWV